MGEKFCAYEVEKERETIEESREKINRLLETISEDINKELGPLVDNECRVNMDQFLNKRFYTEEKLMLDKQRIRDNEDRWSGADYVDTKEEKEKAIKEHEKELEESENLLFEKMVNILLYKILSEEFVVLRTSLHDDQKNGVDHFLVDKDTGNIVCGVDAIESDNISHKKEKVRKINEYGGAKIEYGVTYDKNEKGAKAIKEKIFENVPIFYLSVSKEEFKNLLADMNKESLEPSTAELTFYEKIARSLENQRKEIMGHNLSFGIKEHLKKSEMPLARMKGIRYQKFGYS